MTSAPLSPAYRAVWRWHFYAGLIVLPVMVLLAVTGGTYLFEREIDRALNRHHSQVVPGAAYVSPDRWRGAAEAGLDGEVVRITVPDRPDRAVELIVQRPDGQRLRAFVDPYTANLQGQAPEQGLTETIKRIHSLDQFGPVANALIEIVAGWAIILTLTGLYLWWPRRAGLAGVVTVRGRPSERTFWRDLHAITGAVVGGLIVFLALTGLTWSLVWGDALRDGLRAGGLARPQPPMAQPALTRVHGGEDHGDEAALPWALRQAAVPAEPGEISLTDVMATIDRAGLPRPYAISLPSQPDRAISASYAPDQAEGTRVLYINPADARLLDDVGFAEFGAGARVVEWGIAVHTGRQFGWANRIAMLLACIGIVVMATSALVMWWKRRPAGRLGAPSAPQGLRHRRAVLALVLPLAVLFPLTGLSLLLALALEAAASQVRSRLTPIKESHG